jgi:hypothetical protein
MALPIIPLLAIFAGGLAIAGGGKKKSKSSGSKKPLARGCSPQELFGHDYIDLYTHGGFPEAAMQYVKYWVESNPSSGTAAFIRRSNRQNEEAISKLKSDFDRYWKAQDQSDEYLHNLYPDFTLLKSRIPAAVKGSQTAASEILSDLKCKQSKIQDRRISSLISNKEQWLKILLWAGVLNQLDLIQCANQDPSPRDLVDTVFRAILNTKVLGEAHGPAKSTPEARELSRKMAAMAKPDPGVVSEIRSKLRSMQQSGPTWLFGPLPGGAKPWNELERTYMSILGDSMTFLSGRPESYLFDTSGSSAFGSFDAKTYYTPWITHIFLGLSLLGKTQWTEASNYLLLYMNDSLSSAPLDSGFYPKYWTSWMMAGGGMSPATGVRTPIDWWELYGRNCVSQLLSLHPGLEDDIEGLAIAAIAWEPGNDPKEVVVKQSGNGSLYIKGMEELGTNWILSNFPRMSTMGITWQLDPSFGYWGAVKQFEQSYPLAFYAIVNAMMLIGSELGVDVIEYLDETE